MAYVRKRGRQLLIVQGIRDSRTGKVDQRILFTIYSKAEALHILKQDGGNGTSSFRSLLEGQYPDVRLSWNKISEGIKTNMHVLPDLYEYKETRLQSEFRKDLCSFARQLMLADPQHLLSSAGLIRNHAMELQYICDLIRWRLDFCSQKRNAWNADNPFYWRFALQQTGVPPEIEEQVAAIYERGEYERSAVLFRFLADCFPDYAEGHNYLGLIALKTGKTEDAITHFRLAMELGRKLFPGRIARSQYWNDFATRPYMRGMRNLALALNRAGDYAEALGYCERLERECGDDVTSASQRAAIYLNMGRWRDAADAARKLQDIHALESIVAAFALFESGSPEDAAASFLHAALNFPRAAGFLAGIHTGSPKDRDEVIDLDAGVGMYEDIGRYLSKRGQEAIRFFRRFLAHPRVKVLFGEMDEVKRRQHKEQRTGKREAFDRLRRMQGFEFARREAQEPARLLREAEYRA